MLSSKVDMTQKLYISKPNIFKTQATIIEYSQDDRGEYVVLDKTLFYPQGGGQPADQGLIINSKNTWSVSDVRLINNEIRHYIKSDFYQFIPGEIVTIKVDQIKRILHSKYHTAGHLIAAITEQITNIHAVKGHQFPGEAYIEFDNSIEDIAKFLQLLTEKIQYVLDQNLRVQTIFLPPEQSNQIIHNLNYNIPENKTVRFCCIQSFKPVPCGGTHVSSLNTIDSIKILQCKIKKGKTKIYYEVN